MSSPENDAWKLIHDWALSAPELANCTDKSKQILFLHPVPSDSLLEILNSKIVAGLSVTVLQPFRPYFNQLLKFGSEAETASLKVVDFVFFVPTRQRAESLSLIAKAFKQLSNDGIFVFACANTQGAAGFLSKLKELLPNLEADSKNKCRRAVIRKSEVNWLEADVILDQWISQGSACLVPDTQFSTRPGIYGWNKIDQGSKILLSTLATLTGEGADFGAGYGYLSASVLSQSSASISNLHLIEADFRALHCARENLKTWKEKVYCHWLDVVREMKSNDQLPSYDWIIMNPPFHEGSQADTSLGQAFIEAAASKIKKGGMLYMVANQFLAYEKTLAQNFSIFEKVTVQEGFKVFHARR